MAFSIRTKLVTFVTLVMAVVVGMIGADGAAAAGPDPRCNAEPVIVSEDSETTLLPEGRKLVITQASCSEESESESPIRVVVKATVLGEEKIAAIIEGAMVSRSGGSETIRQFSADVPVGNPGTSICVEINGEETCIPPS